MTGPVSVALFIIPIDLSTLYIVTIIIKDDLQFPQRVSVALGLKISIHCISLISIQSQCLYTMKSSFKGSLRLL